MSAKLTAEFVGTYLLIFTVGCNVLGGQAVWGGVSIACVLMVAIYALGGISGANFNPAVTATLAMVNSMGGPGGMDGSTAGQYIATQLVAGLCAAFSYSALWGTSFNLAPAKGFGWLNAGLCEFFYTFMLCFVVLNVAVAKKTMYYGLAIGFVIVADLSAFSSRTITITVEPSCTIQSIKKVAFEKIMGQLDTGSVKEFTDANSRLVLNNKELMDAEIVDKVLNLQDGSTL